MCGYPMNYTNTCGSGAGLIWAIIIILFILFFFFHQGHGHRCCCNG